MFTSEDRARALAELEPYIVHDRTGGIYQPAVRNPTFNPRSIDALEARRTELNEIIATRNNLVERLTGLQRQLTDQMSFLRARTRGTRDQGQTNRGETSVNRNDRSLRFWFSHAAIRQLHAMFARLDLLSGIVAGVNGLSPENASAHHNVSMYSFSDHRATRPQFHIVNREMTLLSEFIAVFYTDGTITAVSDENLYRTNTEVSEWDIRNELNKFGRGNDSPFGRFQQRYFRLHEFDQLINHMNPDGTINFQGRIPEQLAPDAAVPDYYRRELLTGGIVSRGVNNQQRHNLINSSSRIRINWSHADLIPIKRFPGASLLDHPVDISLALSLVRFFKYIKPLYRVEEVYSVGIDRPPLGVSDPHSGGRAIDLTGFKIRIPATNSSPEHRIHLHLRSGRPLHPSHGRGSGSADMEGYDESQRLPAPSAPVTGQNSNRNNRPALHPSPTRTGARPPRRPRGPSDWFNMASVNDPNPNAYNDNRTENGLGVVTDSRQNMLKRLSVIMTSYFSRVHGPGSDELHMDHFHLDAMENFVPLGTLVNGVYECPATNEQPYPFPQVTRQAPARILQPIAWSREQRRNREMTPDTVLAELRPFLIPPRRGTYYTITYRELEPEMSSLMRSHSSEVESLIRGYRLMLGDLTTLRQLLTNHKNFLQSRQPAPRITTPPTTPPVQNTAHRHAPTQWFTNAGLAEAWRVLTLVSQLNNTSVERDGTNYQDATDNRLTSELSPRNQAGVTSVAMVVNRINAVHTALGALYSNPNMVIRNTNRGGPPEPVAANRATLTSFDQVLNRLNVVMPAFENRYRNATEFQQIRQYIRHNEANNSFGVKVDWSRLIPLKRFPGGPGFDHPIDMYLALAMKRYFTVLRESRFNVMEVYCSGFRHYPMRHDPEAAMSVNITGFKIAIGNDSRARQIILHLRSGFPLSSRQCSDDLNAYVATNGRAAGPSDWYNHALRDNGSQPAYSETSQPGQNTTERGYILRQLIWAAQPFFARIRIPTGDHPNANSFQMEYRSSGTPADHGSLD